MYAACLLRPAPVPHSINGSTSTTAEVLQFSCWSRYHLLHAHDGRTGAPSKSAWSYSHGVIFFAELRPHPPVCLLFPDTHQGGGGVTSPASILGVGDLIYGLV